MRMRLYEAATAIPCPFDDSSSNFVIELAMAITAHGGVLGPHDVQFSDTQYVGRRFIGEHESDRFGNAPEVSREVVVKICRKRYRCHV